MNEQIEAMKKRAAKRRQNKLKNRTRQSQVSSYMLKDEEKYSNTYTSFEDGPMDGNGHPLFNKEAFIFKILASAILVLVVGIMFKDGSPTFEKPRQFVVQSMEQSFQFAAVSKWYEDRFGSLSAILPAQLQPTRTNPEQTNTQYAVPATSRVMENFESNGQGILVETILHSKVEAMNEGWVNFVGKKPDTGNTIIVQHPDKTQTWYGHLATIDVKLFQFVETGTELGRTSESSDGTNGVFYFAIKKEDQFIDPIQVISFE
ncbi:MULTISPECIES: M23 family metallopeptidase [Bacillus]|uniref:M23 family metallopeptidase n=1 Tax=Bacillus TaxID=1386 RepID=UPI000BB9A44E|nr:MULTISPECIES: M23 family metallopeptidase [Bacillus]